MQYDDSSQPNSWRAPIVARLLRTPNGARQELAWDESSYCTSFATTCIHFKSLKVPLSPPKSLQVPSSPFKSP